MWVLICGKSGNNPYTFWISFCFSNGNSRSPMCRDILDLCNVLHGAIYQLSGLLVSPTVTEECFFLLSVTAVKHILLLIHCVLLVTNRVFLTQHYYCILQARDQVSFGTAFLLVLSVRTIFLTQFMLACYSQGVHAVLSTSIFIWKSLDLYWVSGLLAWGYQ